MLKGTCYSHLKTFLSWSDQGLGGPDTAPASETWPRRQPRMPFWVVSLEDKDTVSWEALQSHGIPATVVSPEPMPRGTHLLPAGHFENTHGAGQMFPDNRGLSRFAAGLVTESMEWLSESIKEVGCEWDTHRKQATWMWARVRRAPGSWKRAVVTGTGSQGAISVIYLHGHNFTRPPLEKNQLSLILWQK